MRQEDAERYASAMENRMGNAWTTYTAIPNHKEQTWVVRMYYKNGDYHDETLFRTEADLIHFLIGYAGGMK